MRRARVIGTMALVASMSAVPMAVAAGGHNGHHHHPPAPVHYLAKGVAGLVTCTGTTESLVLNTPKFIPTSIGAGITPPLSVALNGSTKFANVRGHASACGLIKTGDRVTVVWTEPAGTPFSAIAPATRVVDLSRPRH